MIGNIEIRALTIEDLREMGELLSARDDLLGPNDAVKRLKILEWIAFKNPYSNGEPTYFVAVDGDKIVAHLGRMPMAFSFEGQPLKGYFTHDLFVHPAYRAKGKGLFITLALYRAVEENSDSFCCMVWTTELNLEIQKRKGYYRLNSNRYYKFFNPYEKIKRVISQDCLAKGASFLLQLAFKPIDMMLLNLIPAGAKVGEFDSFDVRFDNLDPSIFTNVGISTKKNRDYLNWRFISRPYSNMKVLVVEETEKILGFAVVGIKNGEKAPEGMLVDIIADPDDVRTISSLIKATVKYFRNKKVHSISCCLSDRRFAKVLKRYLFFKDFIKLEPIMLANLEKCDLAEKLTDINRWHLTYGASDMLMFDILKPEIEV